MLRALVIGAGNMGKNHARVLAGMKDVSLVAVADTDDKKLAGLSDRYRVGVHRDYREALAIHKPDIAVIASPSSLHADHAIACIEQGVHVLIEKPLAMTLSACADIGDAARPELVVAVGHIERFNPALVELKHQIEIGNAGRVYEIRCERYSPWPMRVREMGVALDLATHDVDILRYLGGSELKLLERCVLSRDKREDMVSALFVFGSGALGAIHTNWLTPRKIRRVSVTAQQGYFEANLITQELTCHHNDNHSSDISKLHGVAEGETTGFCILRAEPLELELEDFVEAVKKKRPPRVTLHDGMAAVELALKLQVSA